MKTKKNIIFLKGIALSTFFLLYIAGPVLGQLTLTLSANPLIVGERLSLDGVILQVQNNSNFNGNVVIHIYSDRFQKKLVSKSQSLMIQQLIHTFNLTEIFASNDLEWKSEQSTTLCFQIISEKQKIPLGLSCSEITRVKNGRRKAIKKKNKQDFIDANITYEMEALPLSTTPVNHVLDYSGEVRIKEIPIKFQGFFQRNKDPYLGYNLSNFTTFLDVNQWRRKARNKADEVFQKERDSLLSDFPDYQSVLNRKQYVDQVIQTPGALKDLKSIDSLSTLLKGLDLNSKENLLSYKDSLNEKANEMEAELDQKTRDALLPEQRDSLNKNLALLKKRITEAERLYKIYTKKEAYDKLLRVGKNSQNYLQKADSVAADLDGEYQKILVQPNKFNQYLRQHKIGNKWTYLLNHVSDFRIGNVNPGYSQLVLQNSQIKGVSLGLEYGQLGIASFQGRLRNSDLNLVSDSLTQQTKVIGAKIGFAKKGKAKNDFFIVTANRAQYYGATIPHTILGHTSAYQFNDGNTMKFEIAWSLNGEKNSTEENQENGLEKTLRTMAAVFGYSSVTKNGKLTWNLETEYFGPEYFDIENPFLINNAIELSNNIQYSILKGLQIGLSSLYNKGNLWETANKGRQQIISQGVNASYFHKKWPAVQYVFNGSKIEGANYRLNSLFQNLNLSKNYTIKQIQMQSLFNTTYLENNSPLDSIDSKLITIYASQEFRLNNHVRAITAFNYFNLENLQDGRAIDLSYELKIPLNFDRLNVDPGIKWIRNATVESLGWSLNVSWLILKDLSLNVFVNSHWLNGTIDEFGIIKNEYTPHISGRINYRF